MGADTNNNLTLVLVNRFSEVIYKNLKFVLQTRVNTPLKVISLYSHTTNELTSRNLPCEWLNINRHQDRMDGMNRMGRVAHGKMFKDFKVPGTDLHAWKPIMHDRFQQFMAFEKFDAIHTLINSLNYNLVVLPLDIEDALSQYLMRQAVKNQIKSIGYQTEQLRTKENLAAFWSFSQYWVSTKSDKNFLVRHKSVSSDLVSILPEYQYASVREFAKSKQPGSIDVFKQKWQFPADKKTLLIFFTINNIWECRKFFKELVKIKNEKSQMFLGYQIAVFLKSPKESEEFPLLFKKEILTLNIRLMSPESNLFELSVFADCFITFRFFEFLDEINLLAKKTVIFDPFFYNRSNLLVDSKSNILIEEGISGLNFLP